MTPKDYLKTKTRHSKCNAIFIEILHFRFLVTKSTAFSWREIKSLYILTLKLKSKQSEIDSILKFQLKAVQMLKGAGYFFQNL